MLSRHMYGLFIKKEVPGYRQNTEKPRVKVPEKIERKSSGNFT